MGSLFFFAYKYFKEQQDFARNKIYLFEMEQKYLRNQLSPHFLFNTLNNIYSYSLVESKKTPELILKLSELMRYLIDFNKHKQIALMEEISFIENYIAFEKERLEDRCEIVFNKHIENEKLPIEPLLFFPLIENAFKHGTNTMQECYVHLRIEQKGNQLKVEIKNKIIANDKPSTYSGMENVEKRLQLIYTNKYELKINKSEGEYFIMLHIKLNG
jgi:LytS/YehU family sensor histidine kinase